MDLLFEQARVVANVCRSVALVLAIGFAGNSVWSTPTIALEASHSCFDEGPSLSCVRKVLDAELGTKLTSEVISEVVRREPIYSLLQNLAETIGYGGGKDDLDDLKQRSLELKQEPMAHSVPIAALDNAIASNEAEIRSAISTQRLALKASPGTNIYRDFVEQKLAFLGKKEATFYDGGPFEIPRRLLFANALESTYFLKRASGNDDKSLLYKEITLLDEVAERIDNTAYRYLPIVTREPKALQRNGILFWKASILFALGEKPQFRELLRSLAIKTQHFSLETKNGGHIYIYKILDLPYEMIVRQGIGKDGTTPNVDVKDPLLTNRFFNPAQLALVACAHLESAGTEEGITGFIRDINDLTNSDYYVVAGSGDDPAKLTQFAEVLRSVIDQDMRGRRNEIRSIVIGEDGGVATKIDRGAQECGIDDSVRSEIYLPFEFRSKIEHIDGLDHVLFGGRLNVVQANTLAEFLNRAVLNNRDVQSKMGDFNSKPAYIARMPIDKVDKTQPEH